MVSTLLRELGLLVALYSFTLGPSDLLNIYIVTLQAFSVIYGFNFRLVDCMKKNDEGISCI